MADTNTTNALETFAGEFKATRHEVLQTSVSRETAEADRDRVEASATRLKDLEEVAIHNMAGTKVEPSRVADFLRIKGIQALNDQHRSEITDMEMGKFALTEGDLHLNLRQRDNRNEKRTALNGAADLIARGEPLDNTRDNTRQLELVRMELGVALGRLESEARAQNDPEHSAELKAFVDSLPSPDSK